MEDLPEWAEPREYEPQYNQEQEVGAQDEVPPPPPPPVPVGNDGLLVLIAVVTGAIFLKLHRVTNT